MQESNEPRFRARVGTTAYLCQVVVTDAAARAALAAHQTQDLTQVAPPHDPIYIKPFRAMKFTTQHVLY